MDAFVIGPRQNEGPSESHDKWNEAYSKSSIVYAIAIFTFERGQPNIMPLS